jgi:hypothetical protein
MAKKKTKPASPSRSRDGGRSMMLSSVLSMVLMEMAPGGRRAVGPLI